MGYVEERIKYLAVKAWQDNRKVHELTCGTEDCDNRLDVKMIQNGADEFRAILFCYNCPYEQHFVPAPVIDLFLERL